MRVLTLANCPLEPTQGSGYVITGFVAGLRRRGWEVDAFGPETLDPWPTLGRARSLRIATGMLREAERRLAARAYDVVEFYGGEAWLAISRLVARRKRRFLVVSHSNGIETACSEQLVRWLGSDTLDGRPRRWYQPDASSWSEAGFRRADALVTVSHYDRDFALARAYRPPERVVAIENALPDEFLGQPLAPDREPTLIYCGSWIPRKGTALIARDLSRLLADFPRARLLLAGAGAAALADFDPAVRERIEVHAFVADKSALRALYRRAAVAIMPSVYESFGLVAAEAMACGCALVATRTGFAAALEDGREACLLAAPQSPLLREAVEELLRDDERRRAIARAGHARVQGLRWHAATDRLATAYQAWHAAHDAGRATRSAGRPDAR